jgi:hypothetical protein
MRFVGRYLYSETQEGNISDDRNAPLIRGVQHEVALRGNLEADDRFQHLEEPGLLPAQVFLAGHHGSPQLREGEALSGQAVAPDEAIARGASGHPPLFHEEDRHLRIFNHRHPVNALNGPLAAGKQGIGIAAASGMPLAVEFKAHLVGVGHAGGHVGADIRPDKYLEAAALCFGAVKDAVGGGLRFGSRHVQLKRPVFGVQEDGARVNGDHPSGLLAPRGERKFGLTDSLVVWADPDPLAESRKCGDQRRNNKETQHQNSKLLDNCSKFDE